MRKELGQIARANVKRKNKPGLPVSNHVIVISYTAGSCYALIGEPTVDEQAKLFTAVLDLGSARGLAGRIGNISNPTSRISPRSITAICGTPSTKICTHSK